LCGAREGEREQQAKSEARKKFWSCGTGRTSADRSGAANSGQDELRAGEDSIG
jgi:hypothetical protein